MERLHKFLAHAGLASRRHCEELIRAGRVRVNGKVVTALGTRVRPDEDEVTVDGARVRPEKKVYFAWYKPRKVLSTSSDPLGRSKALDFFEGVAQRLYTVGRLDYDAEGLLLVTNDGGFALRAMHPRYEVPRTYRVMVEGRVGTEALRALERGTVVAGRRVRAVAAKVVKRQARTTLLDVTVREGRNREVKRLMARAGHPVVALKRTQLGAVSLGDLKPGRFRRLQPWEIEWFASRGSARSSRAASA